MCAFIPERLRYTPVLWCLTEPRPGHSVVSVCHHRFCFFTQPWCLLTPLLKGFYWSHVISVKYVTHQFCEYIYCFVYIAAGVYVPPSDRFDLLQKLVFIKTLVASLCYILWYSFDVSRKAYCRQQSVVTWSHGQHGNFWQLFWGRGPVVVYSDRKSSLNTLRPPCCTLYLLLEVRYQLLMEK